MSSLFVKWTQKRAGEPHNGGVRGKSLLLVLYGSALSQKQLEIEWKAVVILSKTGNCKEKTQRFFNTNNKISYRNNLFI